MTARALPTIAKLAYVALMLALVSVGTLNMLGGGIKDAELFGVEVSAPAPRWSLSSLIKEELQRDAVQWFEQHWGLRGYAVRTDNALVLSLFRESRSGSAVVADGGVLIKDEDLGYVNRSDPPDEAIATAKLMARVQQKMRARGKALVPVIIPAKTSVHRDAIPARWRRRGSFALSDQNLYGAFVGTLKESGAVFVDGRALLSAEHSRPDEIFAATARHWRMSAGCRVLQATLDAARPELRELASEQIDCHTRIDPEPPADADDFDLFRLLNVWSPPPRGMNVEVLDGAKGPAQLKVPTLFVGSSFVWKFVHVSRELKLLQPSLFYYYNSSVVDTDTMFITKTVEPNTDAWREDTFGKRLFIVGILETYIPGDGQRFLIELEKELDSGRQVP